MTKKELRMYGVLFWVLSLGAVTLVQFVANITPHLSEWLKIFSGFFFTGGVVATIASFVDKDHL